MLLTAEQSSLVWTNELVEDPVPTVTAIAVAPRTIPLPLWSLVPFAAALALLAAAMRGRRRSFSLASARLAFALAVLVSPFGNMAVALPESMSSVPSAGEAKRVLARRAAQSLSRVRVPRGVRGVRPPGAQVSPATP